MLDAACAQFRLHEYCRMTCNTIAFTPIEAGALGKVIEDIRMLDGRSTRSRNCSNASLAAANIIPLPRAGEASQLSLHRLPPTKSHFGRHGLTIRLRYLNQPPTPTPISPPHSTHGSATSFPDFVTTAWPRRRTIRVVPLTAFSEHISWFRTNAEASRPPTPRCMRASWEIPAFISMMKEAGAIHTIFRCSPRQARKMARCDRLGREQRYLRLRFNE